MIQVQSPLSQFYKIEGDCTSAGLGKEDLAQLNGEKLVDYLEFSNAFCGISVQKKGAIVDASKNLILKDLLHSEIIQAMKAGLEETNNE